MECDLRFTQCDMYTALDPKCQRREVDLNEHEKHETPTIPKRPPLHETTR